MKKIILNKYIIAAILFLSAAGVLIAIGLYTNLGEFTTAAFVVSGAACAMSGIFVLTFSGSESVDARRVGLLTAQWCKNICRVRELTGATSTQGIPVRPVHGSSDDSVITRICNIDILWGIIQPDPIGVTELAFTTAI